MLPTYRLGSSSNSRGRRTTSASLADTDRRLAALAPVNVRTHSCIARLDLGSHKPTLARRIGLGRGRSCRQRSKAEPRPRGPRFRMPVAECCYFEFAPER
jgi:hypothetical protein